MLKSNITAKGLPLPNINYRPTGFKKHDFDSDIYALGVIIEKMKVKVN